MRRRVIRVRRTESLIVHQLHIHSTVIALHGQRIAAHHRQHIAIQLLLLLHIPSVAHHVRERVPVRVEVQVRQGLHRRLI